eukprot:1539752-Rhodomonas_salina.4
MSTTTVSPGSRISYMSTGHRVANAQGRGALPISSTALCSGSALLGFKTRSSLHQVSTCTGPITILHQHFCGHEDRPSAVLMQEGQDSQFEAHTADSPGYCLYSTSARFPSPPSPACALSQNQTSPMKRIGDRRIRTPLTVPRR